MNLHEEATKKISRELWNDHLWFRQLKDGHQETVAKTVALIRMNQVKGMKPFAELMKTEFDSILANSSSFGIAERQEVPHA